MNPEPFANAAATIVTSLGALIGIASRRKRLRNEIRENLNLAQDLEKNAVLREQTPAVVWLHTKIALDVARLCGQSLKTPKKPIPWGSVIFSSIVAIGFSYWTYWLNRDTFIWYSILPGAIAFLMLMSAYGSFLNREILPDQSSDSMEESDPAQPEISTT